MKLPPGAVAVIFTSQRNEADPAGYEAASQAMVATAEQQPGYLGMRSVRDESGLGITVSYWASEADAAAWRDVEAHAVIRGIGRAVWYDWYDLEVAEVVRAYDWRR